jgi:glutamyl/glutaminyl-tRNA synthetase
VVELMKPRLKRLDRQAADDFRPFLQEGVVFDAAAVSKHLGKAELRSPLTALVDAFGSAEPFAPAELESTLRSIADAHGIKAGALIHATRVAVTGRAVSPGLFEVLELMGRQRTIDRLHHAIAALPA